MDSNEKLHKISFILNGRPLTCNVRSATVVLELLRDQLELKGTKPGCNEGECGACTVLVNDSPVNSCLYLAVNINGKNITTIEGLAKADGTLDEVQESMVQNGAVQCGFCTSGMVMTIKSMLHEYEHSGHVPGSAFAGLPSREDIKKYLEGNLCRCTGYVKIIEAAEKLFVKEEQYNEGGI